MRIRQAFSRSILLSIIATIWPAVSVAETDWSVQGGRTVLVMDTVRLEALALRVTVADQAGNREGILGPASKTASRFTLEIVPESTMHLSSVGGLLSGSIDGQITHQQGLILTAPTGRYDLDRVAIEQLEGPAGEWLRMIGSVPTEAVPSLDLQSMKMGFDAIAETLVIECGELVISRSMADALGDARLSGEVIGALTAEVMLEWTGGDAPWIAAVGESGDSPAPGGRTVCNSIGPDVIVGVLPNVSNYSSLGGIEALAVGTTSCNIGDEELLWISNSNQHPVIGQNLFRLKTMPDGSSRFEHVGQCWLKHGFTALQNNACSCGCSSSGTGSRLGVGCSDPYGSGLNGSQSGLGPKWEINAYTGYFEYPFTQGNQGSTGDSVYKRLQVPISELDPAQDGGGDYFVEGHYVTPDDASAGNQNNNASYREIGVSGSGSSWSFSFSGMPSTQREEPGIRAWAGNVPGVVSTDVQLPDDGLVILAVEAKDLGGGTWHYEYALQNLNSDRSIRSFSVPVGSCAAVSNIGFHDVTYHSGNPYDGTDWAGSCAGGVVTWSTDSYASNPNANALRWGTLYNFRFDANVAPATAQVTMGLFKPGTPASVLVITTGPDAGPLDCNGNGVDDDVDIANGTSQDCNGNGIPDECETFSTTPLATVRVATGLNRPIYVCSPPGDVDRLFIVEQDGRIKILTSGAVLPTSFLDITGIVRSVGNEQGLLSMAFHPGYDANGYFYVDYTNNSGNTVIARYSVSGDPDIADAGSALILKTINQDFENHNGGQLQFGPDGMLYVGMGDGGNGGDPNNRAQNLNSLLGKMLRLDVDAASPYIPPDNPFVGVAGLDEIWAYGTRNPWRFSFDRLTGDMYIADVGQNAWEEIDFQPALSTGGENYGWRCYEGNSAYNTSGCDAPGTMVFPILEYSHAGGACSVTGGYVYRGCAMPDLAGTYFYAEYCSNWIRSFRYDRSGGVTDEQDRTAELTPTTGAITAISSFGEDAAGELYIVSLSGSVYKIVPQGGGGGICGDGTIDPGEECDDGNQEPGDGCFECQWENNDDCADAIEACPGSHDGSTAGMNSDGSATCGSSSSSPDAWYVYTPDSSGTLTVDTCNSASYDTVLSVHTGCPGTTGNQIGCNDDGSGCSGYTSSLSVSVSAGTTYWIRVSGYSGASGSYTLNITGPDCVGQGAICGNDIVEPGEECDPPDGVTCDGNCQFITCETVIFDDNFETDQGWTAGYSGASSGYWGRGVPVNDAGWAYDPESDSDGSGQCYLTQNELGNTDVDGGAVWLTSPTIDMSGGGVTISYDYFLRLTNEDGSDLILVEINNNDGAGAWIEIDRHDTDGGLSWRSNAISQADLDAAGVTLTSLMRVRFTANDSDPQSIVEAAIDAYRVALDCQDCNNNGVEDATDIANGTSLDINGNDIPDECEVTGDPINGGRMYDKWWAQLGLPEPGADHPLWAFRPDQSSNPSTGSATWRCKECHGWDYKGVAGVYGGGTHRTGFPGVLGTTMTEAELLTLLREQPSNGGGPGVLNGHDFGTVLTDDQIYDAIAFALLGLIDDDGYINVDAEFLGDEVQGEVNFTTGGSISCIVCHGANGEAINFGTPEEPEWVGTHAEENPWEVLHKIRFGNPGTPMPSWLGAGGATQGASDIGRYIQLNFCTGPADGDMDGDGDTDGDDIRIFVNAVLSPPVDPLVVCSGDFVRNGVVDADDVVDMVNALLAP